MDCTTEYIDKHNACGLKVGDRVQVTRVAEDFEDGWSNGWERTMDGAVGWTHTITSDCGNLGFTLDRDNLDYPYFVLEKVEEPAEVPSDKPQSYKCVAADIDPPQFKWDICNLVIDWSPISLGKKKNDPTHKTYSDGTLVKNEYNEGGLEFL